MNTTTIQPKELGQLITKTFSKGLAHKLTCGELLIIMALGADGSEYNTVKYLQETTGLSNWMLTSAKGALRPLTGRQIIEVNTSNKGKGAYSYRLSNLGHKVYKTLLSH